MTLMAILKCTPCLVWSDWPLGPAEAAEARRWLEPIKKILSNTGSTGQRPLEFVFFQDLLIRSGISGVPYRIEQKRSFSGESEDKRKWNNIKNMHALHLMLFLVTLKNLFWIKSMKNSLSFRDMK